MSFDLPHDTYDLAVKSIARVAPWVFFHVAGFPADPDSIRHENPTVAPRERSADDVLIHQGVADEGPFGVCLEYVWQ